MEKELPVTEDELLKEIGRLEMELEFADQKNKNNLDGWTKKGLQERLESCKNKLRIIRESKPNDGRVLLKG